MEISSSITIDEPPSRDLQACVIVPARNEEELLPLALRALAGQKSCDGAPLPRSLYEVIVLINDSHDRSREAAEAVGRDFPGFQLHVIERNFGEREAHIGNVRKLLMDEACRRLKMVAGANGAILSTDADTCVSSNWIAQNLAELQNGAEAVGGRVLIPGVQQERLDACTRALNRYDDTYHRLVSWVESRLDPEPFDPWPRHHQHFGSSLAVRPSVYREVGGLPPVRALEDIAFYQSLLRQDRKLRHSNLVRVFTSARLAGRANAGLAKKLSEWKSQGQSGIYTAVENAAFLDHLFTTRRQLRTIWAGYQSLKLASPSRLKEVATALGVQPGEVTKHAAETPHFGLLLERVNFYEACRKAWPDRKRLAPLADVVRELLKKFRESKGLAAYGFARQSA
ncbi:MAG: glycosyltransferase, partial [Acidobacteriota bacterium]|nr:glycosyltransferase [Acidobacteriota bacterium]